MPLWQRVSLRPWLFACHANDLPCYRSVTKPQVYLTVLGQETGPLTLVEFEITSQGVAMHHRRTREMLPD